MSTKSIIGIVQEHNDSNKILYDIYTATENAIIIYNTKTGNSDYDITLHELASHTARGQSGPNPTVAVFEMPLINFTSQIMNWKQFDHDYLQCDANVFSHISEKISMIQQYLHEHNQVNKIYYISNMMGFMKQNIYPYEFAMKQCMFILNAMLQLAKEMQFCWNYYYTPSDIHNHLKLYQTLGIKQISCEVFIDEHTTSKLSIPVIGALANCQAWRDLYGKKFVNQFLWHIEKAIVSTVGQYHCIMANII